MPPAWPSPSPRALEICRMARMGWWTDIRNVTFGNDPGVTSGCEIEFVGVAISGWFHVPVLVFNDDIVVGSCI